MSSSAASAATMSTIAAPFWKRSNTGRDHVGDDIIRPRGGSLARFESHLTLYAFAFLRYILVIQLDRIPDALPVRAFRRERCGVTRSGPIECLGLHQVR